MELKALAQEPNVRRTERGWAIPLIVPFLCRVVRVLTAIPGGLVV